MLTDDLAKAGRLGDQLVKSYRNVQNSHTQALAPRQHTQAQTHHTAVRCARTVWQDMVWGERFGRGGQKCERGQRHL